ncbi:MAG: polyprenyl synthetase family protein [Leptospirales bacterium]
MISTILEDFHKQYRILRDNWESRFISCLEETGFSQTPPILREAIEYSLHAGGKRLRPVICLGVCEHIKLPEQSAMYMATALECLHTYSLVHDDLPAIDNDDFRRGKPASHKKFGEDTAILVGDALQSLSFELLAKAGSGPKVIEYFSRAVGPSGMVGGQFLDIHSSGQTEEDYLIQMHKGKTGRLFCTSVILPYLYNDPDVTIEPMEEWTLELGLLFQVIDDILDATSSSEKLGKTAGKDNHQSKLTFVSVYGVEKAREIARNMKESLQEKSSQLFPGSTLLQSIAGYFYSRTS